MLYFSNVKQIFWTATAGLTLIAAAYAQTPGSKGKVVEFDAASIRVNEPETGFHFGSSESSTGGPGTGDPGMYRCSKCTLATLVGKAFELQNYQFPGRTAFTANTFDVAAKVAAGTSAEDFQLMLQNLLKERFGLTYHYSEKKMRGYNLVVSKGGSKLKESTDAAPQAAPNRGGDQHGPGTGSFGRGGGGFQGGGDHGHTGVVSFFGSARYRADHQTTADLARLLSDQLGVPVDDQTGLTGKYDVSLNWTGDNTSSAANHAAAGGGAGHGDHGGADGATPRDSSAPALFDALQAQLGLRLVAADQATARIFVVDHAEKLPTSN